MSRSVPGSRSAVVKAAVVCRTRRWQIPEAELLSASWSSTRSVMSRTSRFFAVLMMRRCMRLGFPDGWHRVSGFVGRDLRLVLKRESDIVEPLQQAVTRELVNAEMRRQALAIFHRALFEINGQLIRRDFGGPARDLLHFVLGQGHCEHAIFHAVVGKDVGKRGRNYGAKSEVGQRPDRVLR